MPDILSALLVLGCMIGIFVFIFRGSPGRAGRPPRGVLTRPLPPGRQGLGLAVLTAAAVVGVGFATGAAALTGAAIGLIVGIGVISEASRSVVATACSVIGVVASVAQAVQFVVGDASDPLSSSYRLTLMALIFGCFGGAVVLFSRFSALAGGRGLALFALVDITTFLASPGGADVLTLSSLGHLTFLALVGAVAFVLGWAASEFVLGIAAIAVTVFAVLDQTGSGGSDSLASLAAIVAAAAVFSLVSRLGRRSG